jgi:hypothetical protein
VTSHKRNFAQPSPTFYTSVSRSVSLFLSPLRFYHSFVRYDPNSVCQQSLTCPDSQPCKNPKQQAVAHKLYRPLETNFPSISTFPARQWHRLSQFITAKHHVECVKCTGGLSLWHRTVAMAQDGCPYGTGRHPHGTGGLPYGTGKQSPWNRRAVAMTQKGIPMAKEGSSYGTGGLTLWHRKASPWHRRVVAMAKEGIPMAQVGCRFDTEWHPHGTGGLSL